MPRSNVWGSPTGRAAPLSIPASSAAPRIPGTGDLFSSEERATESLTSDLDSGRPWTPDTVSNTSCSSDEAQKGGVCYASRMSARKNACETEADNYFQPTACTGNVAYDTEMLEHYRRLQQFNEGRKASQTHRVSAPVAIQVHHRAHRLKRNGKVSDVAYPENEQQQTCGAASRPSSESSHVSETESESLHHRRCSAWFPRSAANRRSSSIEELLRSQRRSRYGSSHRGLSSAQTFEGVAAERPCLTKSKGYASQCAPSRGQLGLPESSGLLSNGFPAINISSTAVVNKRYAQRATRAIQRSHSRAVLAAVEKPRRNWERSLRSFHAALRMHTPTDEDGLNEATEEDMDKVSPDMNVRNCREKGISTDKGCGILSSEDAAAVGYESDSAEEMSSRPLLAADSTCPPFKFMESQRAGASSVLPRMDDITLQKRLEVKARRRVHERTTCLTGYPPSVEPTDAEERSSTGASGSSPERSYEEGNRLGQQHSALHRLRSRRVDSPRPWQRCRQQQERKYPATSTFPVAGNTTPFYSFAAPRRDQELSTTEDLNPPLSTRRARRKAYLRHSAEMPGLLQRGRPVGKSNPTVAEIVRGRSRERENGAAHRVSGATGGLQEETRTHQAVLCKNAQGSLPVRSKVRRQKEARSLFSESAKDVDGKRKGDVEWEDQPLSITLCACKKTGADRSIQMPTRCTTGSESEGEMGVDQRGVDARQTLRESPVAGKSSSNTKNCFPCLMLTSEQRLSDAETPEDEMLPPVPQQVHGEQHPNAGMARKSSVNSQPHPSQSESDDLSDRSSGPPSPRFGTPAVSDDEEAEENCVKQDHFKVADITAKQQASTLDGRRLTPELEVEGAGSNSSPLGKARTPEKEGSNCVRNASNERRSDAASDTAAPSPTEEGPDKVSQNCSSSIKDGFSDTSPCLSQDGIETASVLTTASPRGNASFWPASPVSSSPPLRPVGEESSQSSLAFYSNSSKEGSTRAGCLTRAVTRIADASRKCCAHSPLEMPLSISESPAGLTTKTLEGNSRHVKGQSETPLNVAAASASPMAKKLSAPQEPCFVSIEEQQVKFEHLRGAYMAKLGEMQRSPLHSRPQGKSTQQLNVVRSGNNTHASERSFETRQLGSCGPEEANSASGSGNDTLLITQGDAGSCTAEADGCNASTADQDDKEQILQKINASTDGVLEMPSCLVGRRDSLLRLPYELQKAGHLHSNADASNSVPHSVHETVDEKPLHTGISHSNDATDTGEIFVSTAVTKSRPPLGEVVASDSKLNIAAAAEDIEAQVAVISLVQQDAKRNELCQSEKVTMEEFVAVSRSPSTGEQRNNAICTADSCATSSESKDLRFLMTIPSADKVEETGKLAEKQSTGLLNESRRAAGLAIAAALNGSSSPSDLNLEDMYGDTLSAAAETKEPKGPAAATTTAWKSSGSSEMPDATVSPHFQENKALRGQQRQMGIYRCRKGEATKSTAGVTAPVVAIPPSVPKFHPRARGCAILKSSSRTSLQKKTETTQQPRQTQDRLTEHSSHNPIGTIGPGRPSHSLRTLLAREREGEDRIYLPLHKNTSSWTTAIAAAVSPSLMSFSSSTPTLLPAPSGSCSDEAATQSAWSAPPAAATEAQHSLFLRALLTPRAFTHLDGSCITAAGDYENGKSEDATTGVTNSSSFPVFDLISGTCASATPNATHPLVADSIPTTPENAPLSAGTASALERAETSQADSVKLQPATPARNYSNDVSTSRAAPCSTVLSAPAQDEAAIEGLTGALPEANSLKATEEVYTAAEPPEAPKKAGTSDPRPDAAAGTSQVADSVAESRNATHPAAVPSSPDLCTMAVLPILKKTQYGQERSPRGARNDGDTCVEEQEKENASGIAKCSVRTEQSSCGADPCVTLPDRNIISEALDVASQSSLSHRESDKQSKSSSSGNTGQVFRKGRKQREFRATIKADGRASVGSEGVAGKSSRRSHSAAIAPTRTDNADMTAEISSVTFDGSAFLSKSSSTTGERMEKQRMAALTAVANYLRANDKAKTNKKHFFEASAGANKLQGSGVPLTAERLDNLSIVDASAWMGQKASALSNINPGALPDADGAVTDKRRYCITTAGCAGSRLSISSFQTSKAFNEYASQAQVLSDECGNSRSGSSRRTSTSTVSDKWRPPTVPPLPTFEVEQDEASATSRVCEINKNLKYCERKAAVEKSRNNPEQSEVLLQEGKETPEERASTEEDVLYARAEAKLLREAGSRDTSRRTSNNPESFTGQADEEGDVPIKQGASSDDEQSEDEAADIHLQLRLLQAREQEQQHLLEATDKHVQRLHSEMEQLAQKNAALCQRSVQHEQIYQQQRTALAHAKLKILALQAELLSWSEGRSRTSTLSSSSAMINTTIEQQQQEDLQRLEQQVTALRRAIHSRHLLFRATNERLRIANEQLKEQFEKYKEQTLSQVAARSNSDAVLECLSMQIEDLNAEVGRKTIQLQHREQEILQLRAKLEELLQLLRPLKEALRASRQEAAEFQQALKETEERLAWKKPQLVTCSSQTEGFHSDNQSAEGNNRRSQSIKNDVECKGERAATCEKTIQEVEDSSVGVQTDISSTFYGISPTERELKLARALGRQKSLMMQLRQEQHTQTCTWIQQRTQLQEKVGALQARVQQLEDIQNIIMEPDMPQALSLVHSASRTCTVNNSAQHVFSDYSAGGESNAAAGISSFAADTSAATRSVVESASLACSETLVTAARERNVSTASPPIVSASEVATAQAGVAEGENDIFDYVAQVLRQEGDLCPPPAADVLPASASSDNVQLGLPILIKRKANSDTGRISHTSTNTDLSTCSSTADTNELESRLRSCTISPGGKEATALEMQLIQKASSYSPDVADQRRVSPRPLSSNRTAFTDRSTVQKNAAEMSGMTNQVEKQSSWPDGSHHRLQGLRDWRGLDSWISSSVEEGNEKVKLTNCFNDPQFCGAENMRKLCSERTSKVEGSVVGANFDGSAEFGIHTSRARRKVQELRRKLREQGVLS